MDEKPDVVVVGGGIGGARSLVRRPPAVSECLCWGARSPIGTRSRGEFMNAWGAVEARRLGIEDVLLAGGGSWIPELVGYDETIPPAVAEKRPLVMRRVRPEVPGGMDLGHPESCQALADCAEARGARVVRGVGDVLVEPGAFPTVRYEVGDLEQELRCRLVVGADGRASSVRRQLGLTLKQTEARVWGSGLLVEGLDGWPVHRAASGTQGDLQ